MNKQAVLDVLNDLEPFEEEGGDFAHSLIEINDDVVARMNAVGVAKETLEQYGEKDDHFCKWAFAFNEGYAGDVLPDKSMITIDDTLNEEVSDAIYRYIKHHLQEGEPALVISDELYEKINGSFKQLDKEVER